MIVRNLTAGKHTIGVSKNGYKTRNITVNLVCGDNKEFTISLEKKQADVTKELINEILASLSPPNRMEIPPELDRLVLKLMAKNPADRYQSAAEMLTDLARVRGSLQAVGVEARHVLDHHRVELRRRQLLVRLL